MVELVFQDPLQKAEQPSQDFIRPSTGTSTGLQLKAKLLLMINHRIQVSNIPNIKSKDLPLKTYNHQFDAVSSNS